MDEKKFRMPEAVFPAVLYTVIYGLNILIDFVSFYKHQLLDIMGPYLLIWGLFGIAFVILLVFLCMKRRKGIALGLAAVSVACVISFVHQLSENYWRLTSLNIVNFLEIIPFVMLMYIALKEPESNCRKIWYIPGIVESVLFLVSLVQGALAVGMEYMSAYMTSNIKYIFMEIWRIAAIFLIGKWLIAPYRPDHMEKKQSQHGD